jgi:phosphate-selective porin OprO/OprP
MWDGVNEEWFIRQTGIMVAVPELSGNFFIGRSKEGFSLSKVIQGYQIVPIERMTFTDATIPILADGIKYLGYVPGKHLFWNLGGFTDVLSEGQTFSVANRLGEDGVCRRRDTVPCRAQPAHRPCQQG